MFFVKHVLPVPLPILEQVPGQQHVLLAPPARIHYRRTLHRVRRVMPDPLQIPEPVLGQPRVLLAPLVRIHYRRTLQRVRPVPPLPTPPLSNVPLKPIKKLQPVTRGIMENPVTHFVKNVPPLPTPPLFNAPLKPIKQSQPATQDIMEILVMPLANRAVPESGAPRLVLRRTLSAKHVHQAGPVQTGWRNVRIV
jgi:hypothetical protein